MRREVTLTDNSKGFSQCDYQIESLERKSNFVCIKSKGHSGLHQVSEYNWWHTKKILGMRVMTRLDDRQKGDSVK